MGTATIRCVRSSVVGSKFIGGGMQARGAENVPAPEAAKFMEKWLSRAA